MQHNAPGKVAQPAHQDTSKVSSSKTASKQVWTKDQIKEAQEGLIKAGYFKGTANGVLGRRTRHALREYQKANKLPVTGRLDNDVLNKLRSA
jgi:peptidoglycan hydrolase-like protein with peptidoglycan-binding domain